ncbi:hypothetical protein QQ045_002189 [Rhodiola kirilowii]
MAVSIYPWPTTTELRREGPLYTLTIGTGGTKPNISTIGADQFDDFHPKEKSQKLSFFNWWMFSIFFSTLFANTVLVYVQDNVGWTLGYGLPMTGLAISIELHELELTEYAKNGKFRIDSTPTLMFLNKACVKTGAKGEWSLCSVTQVEETKQMLRMIPILFATVVPRTMIAQINTLFVKQGLTLDRKVGNFQIPAASLAGFVTLSMLVCVVLYDRPLFVPIMRRVTKNPRGVTLLQRMGIGMVIHIILMTDASLVENHRLQFAKDKGLVGGGQLPLSIFTLLPQFLLMGTADSFLEVAKIEFFYDQAPENMKSLGTSYSMVSLGVGSFFSSFLLSTVAHITSRNGHKGWVLNNLNDSHLDYYYAFFAILNFLNFLLFLVVSKFYIYKAEVSDSMEVLEEELRTSTSRGRLQEE